MSKVRNKLGQIMTAKTVSLNSDTRTIEVCNDKIIYTLKLDGVKDYLSYNETLLEILKMDKLKPFRDCGRLRFKVNINKSDVNFYLYDLAYGCYTQMITVENFIEDLQRYYDIKSKHNFSIDHADNNIHNNTILNLSFMEKSFNCMKGDIVAKVKIPIYLNSIYFNNKYRIQILFEIEPNVINSIIKRFNYSFDNSSGGIAALHFICDTVEEYVNCLKWLTEQHFEWANPIKDGKRWIKNDNNCWCLEIQNSLHAQKILSLMPENEFQTVSFDTHKSN